MKEPGLHQNHLQEIHDHLDLCLPNEGCGMIAGSQGISTSVMPIDNILKSPTAFEMDPQQLFHALDVFEQFGWDLLAIFHSHPAGFEELSASDRQMTLYKDVYQLLFFPGKAGWRQRAFRWEEREALEIPLTIIQ
jgi:proteasome lid subunit RPN8/RPN11